MIAAPPPAAVLDTNVVLDWLVFADPRVRPLAAALETGALCWIATRPMLEELAAVLRRPGLARWQARLEPALTSASALAQLQMPGVPPLAGHPQCRDPDDQKFIDLALLAPARWLLTRDKALLALARRAALRGVTVCVPERWSA